MFYPDHFPVSNGFLIFTIALIVSGVLLICVDFDKDNDEVVNKINQNHEVINTCTTVVIDSCEYIRYEVDMLYATQYKVHNYSIYMITHKGNCKNHK